MKSYSEQLVDVQRAIQEIEVNGSEVEIEVNGNRRKIRRGDLATLYRREADLKAKADREQRSSFTYIIPKG